MMSFIVKHVFCISFILFPSLLLAEPVIQTNTEYYETTQKEDIKERRDMLGKHQLWGLAAWGFWLATNIEGEAIAKTQQRVGQQTIDLLLLSNPDQYKNLYLLHQQSAAYETTRDSGTHVGLAAATWLTYSVAAYYAFASPDSWNEVKREGFDSIFMHKAMAFIHVAAMFALPFLGEGASEGPDGLQRMRNVGWAGFGAYTIAIGTFYF